MHAMNCRSSAKMADRISYVPIQTQQLSAEVKAAILT